MRSVVAFAVAIPLLAALVIVNRQEIFRGPAGSILVCIARAVGQTAALGLVGDLRTSSHSC